jgi:thioredoxin 1
MNARGVEMKKQEDKELERIRLTKMQEMIKKSEASEKKGKVSSKPIEVTDSTFEQLVAGHPLVVVDCWAAWCGPCRMVAPVIDGLARDYAGKVLFGKLNVDENRKVSVQYEIMSIPTLLVFKNGKLVDRIIGATPRQTLEPKITRHL